MWDLIVSVPDHCLSFYFSSCGHRGQRLSFCCARLRLLYFEKAFSIHCKMLYGSIFVSLGPNYCNHGNIHEYKSLLIII